MPKENDPRKGLSLFKSHKVVGATQIKSIEHHYANGKVNFITITGAEGQKIRETVDYLQKFSPKEGGYYVVYEDGYKSFSPAAAFEGGYKLKEAVKVEADPEEEAGAQAPSKTPEAEDGAQDASKTHGEEEDGAQATPKTPEPEEKSQ